LANALARTGATSVMLVAPFGIRQDFTVEIELCRRHRATIVIDNAAGLGVPRINATADDHLFEVFSMHATKPFAVGEGGVVFAHRDQDAPLRAALGFALTSHDKPEGPHWGFNGKMSEFHAAVGLSQLERFGDLIRARQDFVVAYQQHLARWPALEFPNDATRAPWQCFPVLFPRRAAAERFVSAAARAGVEIRRYYRPSLSRWPGTACFGPCPVAEELADRMCVLPVRSLPHGAARDEIIGAVMAALEEACSEF
jgi:dTDP-4-amino-4,6-dideoxygalactose transaminase